MPDIQSYFEYVTKKHETITDEDSPIKIFPNKIKNRITFTIKNSEIIDKDQDSELVPKIGNLDLVKVHCNVVLNNYQQASNILFTFVLDSQFGQLMTFQPKSLLMLKTTSAEYSFIDIYFTDQNNRPLEIEDSVNVTLIAEADKALI